MRMITTVVRSPRRSEQPIFLNADHTHSLESSVEAAKAGFDAVVIDFSTLPFDENVRRTREVVDAVRAIDRGILVEGEIGNIGSGSRIHEGAVDDRPHLTTADEAKRFVDATGIDVLAPAVGNRHGMVAGMVRGDTKKRLDAGRIAEIKQAAGVFLTLHGGSGTDDDDFRRAIDAGINVVHINTELRVAWRHALETSLARAPGEVVPYEILSPVVDAVKEIVRSRLRLFGARPPTKTRAVDEGASHPA